MLASLLLTDDRKVLSGEVIGQFLHLRRVGAARVQHRPAVPVDGARVRAVEGDNVAAPAVGIIEVQVCERLPAAAQPDDLDIVLAAAVDNGFYHRVEAGNVATTCEDADAFLRHDRLSTARSPFRRCMSSMPFRSLQRGPCPKGGHRLSETINLQD